MMCRVGLYFYQHECLGAVIGCQKVFVNVPLNDSTSLVHLHSVNYFRKPQKKIGMENCLQKEYSRCLVRQEQYGLGIPENKCTVSTFTFSKLLWIAPEVVWGIVYSRDTAEFLAFSVFYYLSLTRKSVET